jgi:hypothetical protein
MERTKLGEFCWIDLIAAGLESQTAFYEALFGWTHVDTPTDIGPIYRQFHLGEQLVAGASQRSEEMAAQGVPTMWNLYIATEDADAMAQRAVELGGQVAMPAMDVMQEGRMVGIMDPSGGAVFFWQAGRHKGASLFGVPGSLTWNDLNTRDPEGAAAFFRQLLPWQIERGPSEDVPYWQITVDGMPEGGIMAMPPMIPEQVPPHWLVYFGAEDVPATMARASELGGKAQMEPMTVEGVEFGVLSDPQGATFAVMKPMGT